MNHPTKECEVKELGTVYTYTENGVRLGGIHFIYEGRTYGVEWECREGLKSFFRADAEAALNILRKDV